MKKKKPITSQKCLPDEHWREQNVAPHTHFVPRGPFSAVEDGDKRYTQTVLGQCAGQTVCYLEQE